MWLLKLEILLSEFLELETDVVIFSSEPVQRHASSLNLHHLKPLIRKKARKPKTNFFFFLMNVFSSAKEQKRHKGTGSMGVGISMPELQAWHRMES